MRASNPTGPDARDDRQETLRADLDEAARRWTRQLRQPEAAQALEAMAREADRLRVAARGCGWTRVAEVLAELAKSSSPLRGSPQQGVARHAAAIEELRRATQATAVVPTSATGTSLEAEGLLPPKPLPRSLLGLRVISGVGDPGESKPLQGTGGTPGASLLGLAKLDGAPAVRPDLSPRTAVGPRPRRTRAARETSSVRGDAPPSAGERAAPPPRWFYVLSGAMGLLGASVVAFVVAQHGQRGAAQPPAPAAVAATALSASATGSSTPDTPHASPELRALIEGQIRLMAECRVDPTRCGGWTPTSQAALTPLDPQIELPASRPVGAGLPPAWLRQLKIPAGFPLYDDPTVKGVFEYRGRNIAGRAQFQHVYFNCSAYEDIIDGALIRYGAPAWLKAVVYQESGCDPVATSPVGAKGLWQFMPESARAYGLRVLEDEVDERLDPVKATDAAIHFLTDLHRDLGAWDLALAAYNAGPFAITTRVTQLGGRATFWDLVAAGVLPKETAGYVPAIEAYALVLENLRGLRLGGGGRHPQSTSEILVKPGMRLSLIARAAHTSATHIRELNRAYLRDVVPQGESTAWVPDSEAHRAQVFLDSLGSDDDTTDTCVPEDFDWGTTVLETSKYAKKCGH